MKMTYRFIVVEDVELQRQHITGLLQSRLDLEFQAAFENAQEAYQYLASGKNPMPDLLFLDVEMPEASGFSLLESLRRLEPSFRVIFVTAFPEYAIKGYEYNASAYLLKPVEPDKLFRAVDKAIRELNTPAAPHACRECDTCHCACLSSLSDDQSEANADQGMARRHHLLRRRQCECENSDFLRRIPHPRATEAYRTATPRRPLPAHPR